jgi:hypothetical protein
MKEWTAVIETAVHVMLIRVSSFFVAGAVAYAVLAAIFWLVCLSLGHNSMEMMYGATAIYLFTLVAAVAGAWTLPDDIRNWSSSIRLTHWFRSR